VRQGPLHVRRERAGKPVLAAGQAREYVEDPTRAVEDAEKGAKSGVEDAAEGLKAGVRGLAQGLSDAADAAEETAKDAQAQGTCLHLVLAGIGCLSSPGRRQHGILHGLWRETSAQAQRLLAGRGASW
jgi:hypothetical protein